MREGCDHPLCRTLLCFTDSDTHITSQTEWDMHTVSSHHVPDAPHWTGVVSSYRSRQFLGTDSFVFHNVSDAQ